MKASEVFAKDVAGMNRKEYTEKIKEDEHLLCVKRVLHEYCDYKIDQYVSEMREKQKVPDVYYGNPYVGEYCRRAREEIEKQLLILEKAKVMIDNLK